MEREKDELQEKILASAREEFIRCGYQEASLRRICRQAGLTTGALYKRFKNKDDLFISVLEPTLAAAARYAEEQRTRDYQLLKVNQLEDMWQHRLEDIQALMRLFYQHKETMQLLLFRSQGSSQEHFKADMPRFAGDETYHYLQQAYEEGKIAYLIERPFLDAAMTAYYTALVEPLAQDWPEETALAYCGHIVPFFDWARLLGFYAQ